MIRLNLPSIDLETIVFDDLKPYFYIINENYVEKYAYQLTVPIESNQTTN